MALVLVALLVLQTIVFMFVLCQIAVLWTTLFDGEFCALRWTAILVALLPFVPYVASTLVSVNKKKKGDEIDEPEKAEETPEEPMKEEPKPAKKGKRKSKAVAENKDGWLETNQIPNDVTKPLEKDVTKNLVDEPRPTPIVNE